MAAIPGAVEPAAPASEPAAPAAEPAAATPAAEPAAPASWLEGSDADTLGYVTKKGWKEPGDVLKSYRNLEQLTRLPAEQLVRLPGDPDDAEAWSEVHAKLGRPEGPDGYQFDNAAPPEGTVDLAPWFREQAHAHGLNQRQAAGMLEAYNAQIGTLLQEQEETKAAQLEQDVTALKREWGTEYEANVQAGKRFAAAFGLEADFLEGLEGTAGYLGLMKGAARIGRGLAEHSFVDPGNEGEAQFGMTPDVAKAKIAELRADPQFQKAYLNLDGQVPAATHKEAKDRMTQLMQVANPEPA